MYHIDPIRGAGAWGTVAAGGANTYAYIALFNDSPGPHLLRMSKIADLTGAGAPFWFQFSNSKSATLIKQGDAFFSGESAPPGQLRSGTIAAALTNGTFSTLQLSDDGPIELPSPGFIIRPGWELRMILSVASAGFSAAMAWEYGSFERITGKKHGIEIEIEEHS